ncbi:MerR family transcriptional regulator [Bradyrhizobium sp. U87765 SZCCT0131]|uniref:MerR family transcriptional regulator n=1 Tax=unclassified Bradyrhizobium TaxID=2631580 RepID=UPI001BAAED3F|nr:MerR family transcriptional regulator [Bradyrhizobium sp. U87765 SZCCT0131]MBR1262108.1 MerR family transcriptional regulator [Bradyrhizobium sp. U87765 SZCCT0134]MBR1306039.1 MerR family transcriptional regulator [Bradyrhizobium sp. U87765 SZCCT0110]MBR1317890.1 MerR family transcriptional regulator [Bradyrhizobium sp. U87765 SZCCT0109]MBR1351592.1 MerR family transcriptional regulator [Bradyrhizobium sp. U87765 SZCCT0048]
MKIGELSRRTGVSVRMLRYYEAEGLLAPARTGAGYRDYDASAEVTVRRIRLLGEAGLKLDAVRQLLPCLLGDTPHFVPCAALRAGLAREMKELDARIGALTHSRRLLAGFLKNLPEEGAVTAAAPVASGAAGRRAARRDVNKAVSARG